MLLDSRSTSSSCKVVVLWSCKVELFLISIVDVLDGNVYKERGDALWPRFRELGSVVRVY